LNDDEEREHGIIGRDIENGLTDQKMCSGRNRNEFGQSLNDAEEEGWSLSFDEIQCNACCKQHSTPIILALTIEFHVDIAKNLLENSSGC
jgi:hypothetical protein